jgi:hypothetical protein
VSPVGAEKTAPFSRSLNLDEERVVGDLAHHRGGLPLRLKLRVLRRQRLKAEPYRLVGFKLEGLRVRRLLALEENLVAPERRLYRFPGMLQMRGPRVQVRGRVRGQRVALAAEDVGDVGPQGDAWIIAKEGLVRRPAGGGVDRCVDAECEGRQEALPVRDLGIGVENGGAKVFGRVPVHLVRPANYSVGRTDW